MEDMNDMLGSLLSDPESMQQIKELADMLKSEMPSDGKSGESGQNGQSSQGGFDFGSLAGLTVRIKTGRCLWRCVLI